MVAGGLGIVLSCAGLGILMNHALYDGALPFILGEDTEYAPGYNERVFRRITTPISVSELERLLGKPTTIWEHTPPETTVWRYTRSPTDGNFRIRQFHILDGGVVEKYHEYWVD